MAESGLNKVKITHTHFCHFPIFSLAKVCPPCFNVPEVETPMGLREDLLKRIEKKQAEIEYLRRDYEDRMREAGAYLQALQDTLKIVPKTGDQNAPEITLRHGSNVAKARDAIKAVGRPLHISEILRALDFSPSDKKQKLALSGSIAAYVRQQKIFTRPSPNTFGLVELESSEPEAIEEEEIAKAATEG